MKKYTDTELLEELLLKLNYSTITSELNDTVDVIVNESFYKDVEKDFVVALQKRINELRKKVRVKSTSYPFIDEDADCSDANDGECLDRGADSMCCDCADAERTYSSKEYYDLIKESLKKDHEITLLKRKVEALEYLIYACIPSDDRRAD